MKSFNRITGFILAVLLVVGMLPAGAFASTTTYTGIDARVYNAVIGENVSQAQPNIQFATDEMSEIHKPDNTVNITGTWYHTVDDISAVSANIKDQYAKYYYDAFEVYARPVTNDEKFLAENTYLYVAELTPTNGVFDELCLIGPIGKMYANITSTKATVYIPIVPTTVEVIDWVNFTCSNTGDIDIVDKNNDWVYLYRTDDGGTIPTHLYQETVGQYVLNNAEYSAVNSRINVMNAPVITLYAVPAEEWNNGRTAKVVAYGTYTIPMSDPYIQVDTLTFGEAISITEIGTTTGGKYHWNIASANFEGWFQDKEGKTPATVEADAYAVFTLRSYGLFSPDINAANFTLKCNAEQYGGAYLIPTAEANVKKVAFFVPSNSISFALECIGKGGSINFANHPDESILSMRPMESGKYEMQDIVISIDPGYYLKSLTINGKEWDDIRNPMQSGMIVIPNEETFYASIPSFEPTEDTVIKIEVAEADLITIDYGSYKPAYTGRYADETKWHSNGKYWVSESNQTELCYKYAIVDYNSSMTLKGLNTKPDGSGISVPMTSTHFYWEPTEEFQNGLRDEITLYVIMECNAHTAYGAEDNAWEYYEAKDATCTEDGYIAHRYCPNCQQYQVKNKDGNYVASTRSEVMIKKLPHEHTVYQNTSDTHHTVKCANCSDSYTEKHNLQDGVCVCGYYTYILGDVNGDGYVTDADAVHLLYYTIFPEDYPINQIADFNGDGYVTDADAVHLLYYTIFPEDYPLQ